MPSSSSTTPSSSTTTTKCNHQSIIHNPNKNETKSIIAPISTSPPSSSSTLVAPSTVPSTVPSTSSTSTQPQRDWMEHRIRLFQETLQQKLSDPFLVRRYEGLYYHDAPSVSSTRKIATTATVTTKTEPEGTTHNHEDTSSSTTRGDSTNTTKGGDTDDRKKFRKIRLTTDEALKLSHIPWELRQHDNAGGERTTMEGGTTTTNSRQPPPKFSNESSSSSHYMHESHLDLRLMQNTHWAEGRLAKGVEFAKLALEATTASGAPNTNHICDVIISRKGGGECELE